VAGARRPQAEIRILKQLQEKVELCAVCDPNETLWSVWKEQFPGARFYRTLDDLLSDDTVNAIIVATPLRMHAEQSVAALKAGKHVAALKAGKHVAALKAGKHVLSEVPAATRSSNAGTSSRPSKRRSSSTCSLRTSAICGPIC